MGEGRSEGVRYEATKEREGMSDERLVAVEMMDGGE